MWAGGRLKWHAPLARRRCGVQRTSRIASITHKAGRTGDLVFVLVGTKFARRRRCASPKSRTSSTARRPQPGDSRAAAAAAPAEAALVARGRARPGAAVPLFGADLQRPPHPLRPQLRHRGRGLPGLVVHGPLIATLLVDLLRRHAPRRCFAVLLQGRAARLRPAILHRVGQPSADGKTVQLWARDHEGWLTMQATAKLL